MSGASGMYMFSRHVEEYAKLSNKWTITTPKNHQRNGAQANSGFNIATNQLLFGINSLEISLFCNIIEL